MIADARARFNRSFSEEKYRHFLEDLNTSYQQEVTFRVAETPVFISRQLREKLLTASNDIIDVIIRDDYAKMVQNAIPPHLVVPNQTPHTLFLALDYAVVMGADGSLEPQLIEMQGFPSLFGWQDFVARKYREHFDVPVEYFNHFNLTEEQYRARFSQAVLNGHDPREVVLLEIDPIKQNTAIDFAVTRQMTGVDAVHIGDVEREGRQLFYRRNGQRTPIRRIYNRVIFDELIKRTDLNLQFNLTEDVEVEWAGHPNWFFRISKYTMPFIQSRFVPECRFLHQYTAFPDDLENYVLKPLFSFSGTGVIFHLTRADLEAIAPEHRHEFLLQRKVKYEPVVQAPDGQVKVEIRMLFLWEDGKPRPEPVTNLARLSRGDMIGVKYNKDKTWVGGSVCFFEP